MLLTSAATTSLDEMDQMIVVSILQKELNLQLPLPQWKQPV
jgi:hypothetical protein